MFRGGPARARVGAVCAAWGGGAGSGGGRDGGQQPPAPSVEAGPGLREEAPEGREGRFASPRARGPGSESPRAAPAQRWPRACPWTRGRQTGEGREGAAGPAGRGRALPFPLPSAGVPPPAEGARRRPPEPRPRAGAVRQPRGPGPAPCETGRPLRRRGLRLRRRVTERRLACWHSGLRALYLIPKLCAFSIRIRSALAVRLVFVLLAEETRLSWAIAGRPLGSGSGALGLRPAGSLCLSVSLWLTKPGLRRKPASRCSHSAAFPSLLPSS